MEGVSGVDGLISGLPTSEIIESSMQAARASTVLVEQRKELSEARLEAVRNFNIRMLSARLDVSNLRRDSTFDKLSATPSNESALTAKASTSAVAGSYNLSIDRVATAQQLATGAQSSASASNGTGTLQLQVGDGQVSTLDFSGGASSLNEIATAINNDDLGITAFVFNDGTGQRLMLQSDQSGSEGTITATGTGDLATVFGTANSNLQEVAAAQDARIFLGSGAGQIQIDSSSNTIEGVIPGVSLELKEAAANVTVSVGNDTSEARETIATFVESLNDALQYFNDNASFDAGSGEAGILFSEQDLRSAVNGLRSDLLGGTGTGSFSTLAGIGITIDEQTGLFEIDDARLGLAFAQDPEAVRDLFVNSGTASAPGVEFVSLNQQTALDAPFTVDVTQVAKQAEVLGTTSLASSITIDEGVNDQLFMNINGRTANATLAAGTYTPQELTDHLGAVLADAAPTSADTLDVSLDGSDRLVIRSDRFGSAANISFAAESTALADLQIADGVYQGQDVAGTINGVTATGSGQVLRGVAGTDSEGLVLSVSSSAPVSNVEVTVGKGLAQVAHERLSRMTDSATGLLAQKQDFLETSIEDMTEQIKEADELLDLRRERMRAEFLRLEQLLGQFQTQENFLAGQITAFQNMAASRATGNSG